MLDRIANMLDLARNSLNWQHLLPNMIDIQSINAANAECFSFVAQSASYLNSFWSICNIINIAFYLDVN